MDGKGADMGMESEPAFAFTEARVEAAIRLVRAGKTKVSTIGRRIWRDSGSGAGLYLYVGQKGASFYRREKKAGRLREQRIGDALAMRVSTARDRALKLAAGVASAAAKPIRRRLDGPTVAEAWEAYIEAAASGAFVAGRKPTAASTIASYKILYGAHLKDRFAGKGLDSLADAVAGLHADMRSTPVAANRLLQVASNLFAHAHRSGTWTKANPCRDAATGRGLRKHYVASRERWLTTAEAAALMAAAAAEPDPWCDFWPLLLLTGVRVSNLREAQWASFDLREAGASWQIPMTKAGRPHAVPLTSEAVEILRARKKRAGSSPLVFPMKEDPSRPIADADHAFGRIKEASGIKDIRIHDLRRTAASWATQAGLPAAAVGRLIGDTSPQAIAVYARADDAGARAAAAAVAARLAEAKEAGR